MLLVAGQRKAAPGVDGSREADGEVVERFDDQVRVFDPGRVVDQRDGGLDAEAKDQSQSTKGDPERQGIDVLEATGWLGAVHEASRRKGGRVK